jgi:diadenosine tetraphosphate (Ap4A) HIT family hydrolase
MPVEDLEPICIFPDGHALGGKERAVMRQTDALDPDCVFCHWIRRRQAVDNLGTMTAFDDGFPVTEGHLLIVPLRHTSDWLAMTEAEMRDSEALIRTLTAKIRARDVSVTGFNIGTNIGASAGQTVFHAHIHLIPRRDGDSKNPRGGIRGVIDGKRCY